MRIGRDGRSFAEPPGNFAYCSAEIGWKPACLSIAIWRAKLAGVIVYLLSTTGSMPWYVRTGTAPRNVGSGTNLACCAGVSAMFGAPTVSRFSHRRLKEACDSARAGAIRTIGTIDSGRRMGAMAQVALRLSALRM